MALVLLVEIFKRLLFNPRVCCSLVFCLQTTGGGPAGGSGGLVAPCREDQLELKGSYAYLRDWVSRNWGNWKTYLAQKHHLTEQHMVESMAARHGRWDTAPDWKEFNVSTDCMLALLVHWSEKLKGKPATLSKAILRSWLQKAVPAEDMIWHASTQPEIVSPGPHAEATALLWEVRVSRQRVCLSDLLHGLQPPDKRVLERPGAQTPSPGAGLRGS